MINTIDTIHCPMSDRKFQVFTHPSGLRVRLMPLEVSVSSVSLAVGCGSIFERTGEENLPGGCAHFIEHMVFHAPDGEDYGEKFLRLGAPDLNAYTSEEITNYYYRSENPCRGLELLLKMVLEPSFDKKFIALEKKIISSEIQSDEYDAVCSQKLVSLLFKKQYIRHDPGGSPSSVRRVQRKHLVDLHALTYVPSNMVLSIVGRYDVQEVIRLLDTYFAGKAYPDAPKYPPVKAEVSLRESNIEISGKGYPRTLYMGLRDRGTSNLTAQERLKRGVSMLLASQMLEEALESSLSKDNLVTAPSVDYIWGIDCGYLYVRMATSRHEAAERRLRQMMQRILTGSDSLQKDFSSFLKAAYANAVRLYDDGLECALFLSEEPLWGCEVWDKLSILKNLSYEEFYETLKSAFDHRCWSSIYVKP